jgi:tetratricopeptide (TPR) repeat protein
MGVAFHFRILAVSLLCSCSLIQAQDTVLVRNIHKKAFSFLSTYPDSLLFYRDSSYRMASILKDNLGIAESYTDLGIYHWLKGDYAAAIQAYDTSNQIFIRIKRPDKQMMNLSNLGMVYSRLGDFPKAINFFLASLRLSEELGDKEAQAKTYNSLGVAYKNQNNLEEAFQTYTKALTLFKEIKNQESVAGCYTNIGNIHVLKKDYEQGLDYQKKALFIFDSLQNFRGLVTCYNNISDIHLARKNLKDALTYRQQALTLSKTKGFFSSEVAALSGIGMIYTELEDYKTAERSFLEAIDLARKKNYRTQMVSLYKGLSACYKRLGNISESLRYYEDYSNLKDSLFNQQSLVTISNLQTSYDLEKKEASIQLLRKDNEITMLSRNRTIIAALGLLLVAGLVVVWQRSKIRKDRLLHSQQKKLHQTEQALSKAELESSRIKEEELLKELAYKNKSLTTYALSMVQKNEILEEVKESVELIIKKPDNQAEHFKKLSRIIDYGFTLDKDWEDFKLYFEDVHTDFFTKLRERYPDLGGADLKLCALIRLNLNVKQAAAILRISPDSVKVARYRLRKKFNLQTEDNLTGFIMAL